jgi:hypothetical protein
LRCGESPSEMIKNNFPSIKGERRRGDTFPVAFSFDVYLEGIHQVLEREHPEMSNEMTLELFWGWMDHHELHWDCRAYRSREVDAGEGADGH